ncbi:hypothetical protein AUO95_02835 [Corynebacterium glutamicum]|nr:hypothetical protein AUO95_02835 [Corynebacterium glutamicum]
MPILAFSAGGFRGPDHDAHGNHKLDSWASWSGFERENQTQMPTDRRFEDREHACLVCLEKGDFMAEDPKSSTSQNRF